MLGFLLIACVVFGLLAYFIDDAKIKQVCYVLLVISAAVLIVLILLAVLSDAGIATWPWPMRAR
jgi:hypothetical protein